MLTKRSLVGLIIGSIIIVLGGYSLILQLGPTIDVTEHFFVGSADSTSLTIPAPANAPQTLKIIGNSFDLKLQSPGDGKQIPNSSYKNELILNWVHLVDGDSKILIQNTGNNELEITAITKQTPDPIGFTFDLMVIISGIVIIGFSMGFTLRKPKGF